MPSPRLIDVAVPTRPEALVVVLHGGASRPGSPMVSPTQLSVARMVPIAHRLARVGRPRIGVVRLLNSVRGWDSRRTPVDDAHWALDQLAERYGPHVPIGLVGHSLGGRAALLACEHPGVRSVVALNPWVYGTDGALDASGRHLLIVHGDADRIADPSRSVAVAADLRNTAPTTYVSVRGAKHAMLRRHDVFSGLAADFTAAVLLGREPSTSAIAQAMDGCARIDV